MECRVEKTRPITPELHDSNRFYLITPSSRFCKLARACCKAFDEAALVQFGDETGVHEGVRFVVPDIRSLRRDIFVGRLQSLGDRIGDRDEILAVNFVGAFEQFAIGGFEILAQNLHARLFVRLEKMNRFDVRFDHAHDGVAIFGDPFAPRHDRHGRISYFLFSVPQYLEAFAFGLSVGWMRGIGSVDKPTHERLNAVGLRADGEHDDVAAWLETVLFNDVAFEKIAEGAEAGDGYPLAAQILRFLDLGSH